MTEFAEVETPLCTIVTQLGGACIKFVSPGYTGVSDRIVMFPRVIAFVECKRPGVVKLRPRQERWQQFLELMEFRHYVVNTKKEAIALAHELYHLSLDKRAL